MYVLNRESKFIFYEFTNESPRHSSIFFFFFFFFLFCACVGVLRPSQKLDRPRLSPSAVADGHLRAH